MECDALGKFVVLEKSVSIACGAASFAHVTSMHHWIMMALQNTSVALLAIFNTKISKINK